MQRTPVANYDDALDVIEHVNQDHTGDLKAIVQSIYPNFEFDQVQLLDLFEEGALVGTDSKKASKNQEVYIPFEIQGTLEEKLFHLAYAHSDHLESQKTKNRFLTVTESRALTDNFIRITVSSEQPFPSYWAGLCFSVHLKVLNRKYEQTNRSSLPSKIFAHCYKSISNFLMKVLSVKLRRSLVESSRKDLRAYTLRNSWQTNVGGKTQYFGSIDVFTHGNSRGSIWAAKIKPGDIIYTSGDHPDKHPALASGHTVIFCDETAYPAAAGILESWTNPVPPTLIIISEQESEQQYFSEVVMPKDTVIKHVVCHYQEQGNEIIKQLEELTGFDTVWGAMEMKSAKQVRHYLRNFCQLKGANNLVKPYWRSDKE